MASAYFMLGLPGSGKTTYIQHHLAHLPIVSRDIIRTELGYTKSAEQKRLLSPQAEQEVSKMEYKLIAYYCANNIDFVIDDTNSKRANRETLLGIIRHYPTYKTVCIWLRTDLKLCIERRRGQIKEITMVKLNELFEEPQPNEFDCIEEITISKSS